MDSRLDYLVAELDMDRNYTANAFELVKSNRNYNTNRCVPMLQVIYNGVSQIRINGVFIYTNDSYLIAFDKSPTVFPSGENVYKLLPPTLFKYPAYKHFGQLEP